MVQRVRVVVEVIANSQEEAERNLVMDMRDVDPARRETRGFRVVGALDPDFEILH